MSKIQTLEEMLMSEVKKTDDQKAKEAVKREVKRARRAAINELGAADEALDMAKDRLEAAYKNSSASLATILEAQRNVELAEANFKALETISATRFGK